MSGKPIIASYATGNRYWSRTQRDAGIEHLAWEDRVSMPRSWSQIGIWTAEAVGLAWLLGACIFLALAG